LVAFWSQKLHFDLLDFFSILLIIHLETGYKIQKSVIKHTNGG